MISLPAPAASVVMPATTIFPLSVIAPAVVTFRFPLTFDVPRSSALASRSVTLLPLFTATVLKLFPAESRVMSLPAPAASVVVPVTTTLPLSVMAPPAVTLRVPFAVRVGRFTGALSKVSVRLRRLVSPDKVGTVAPGFVLRSPISRKFPSVPPKDKAPAKLLAWVFKTMSVFAALAVREVVPATLSAALWVQPRPSSGRSFHSPKKIPDPARCCPLG